MFSLYARNVIFGLIVCLPSTAFSQGDAGVMTGTVFGLNGETMPDMHIQATHDASGEYARTRSDANGQFNLTNLVAGSYTVTIYIPCCEHESYKQEEIVITSGETTSLEIHLEKARNFATVGDASGVSKTMRKRQEIPDLPVPRSANGKPNLSGMWAVGNDPYPQGADAHPWAAELRAERIANDLADWPHRLCLPGDAPIPTVVPPILIKLVQTEDLLVMLFEDVPGFRQIFLDGRKHPDDPNPSWLGHSIGHWDDDVLVVDTVGYNDRGWLSGYPQTEDLHIIERYTRTEYGHLELEVSIEDPTVFKSPWIKNLPLELMPQEELLEYVCENNVWAQ